MSYNARPSDARSRYSYGRLIENARAVVTALAVLSLTLGLGRGNQLLIAVPLAVWVAILLSRLGVQPRTVGQHQLQGINSLSWLPRSGVPDAFVPAITWLCCAGVWVVCMLTCVPKVLSDRPAESDIVKQIEEATKLFEHGDLEASLNAFRAIEVPVRLPMRRAQNHHNCGVLLYWLGRNEEAAVELRSAVQFDRKDQEAWYLLGQIAYTNGQHIDAVEYLQRAQRIQPHTHEVERLLASIDELR